MHHPFLHRTNPCCHLSFLHQSGVGDPRVEPPPVIMLGGRVHNITADTMLYAGWGPVHSRTKCVLAWHPLLGSTDLGSGPEGLTLGAHASLLV